MIICHCTGISDHDIHAAINWMRASDPETVITPGKVYRALGHRSNCGGCLPLFMATMTKNSRLEIPQIVREPEIGSKKGGHHEGRQ